MNPRRRLWSLLGAAVLIVGIPAAFLAMPALPARAQPDAPALLTAEELDELVAPIALYPDVVLDSLLPATTTPLDVVAAGRHLTAQGGQVAVVPNDVDWSPAVLALLQFPEVVQWMGDNLPWLERMGQAVAVQPDEVLAAIQRLRERAHGAGVLVSNDYQRVVVQREAEVVYVVIEPARPDVVYVPVYEPWPLLLSTYAVQPSRSPYRTWWGFSFGDTGLWSQHRIRWARSGRGIYAHASPWWWRSGRVDAQGAPTRWSAANAPRAVVGVRRPANAPVVRPMMPAEATASTPVREPRTRRVFVAPQVGVTAPASDGALERQRRRTVAPTPAPFVEPRDLRTPRTAPRTRFGDARGIDPRATSPRTRSLDERIDRDRTPRLERPLRPLPSERLQPRPPRMQPTDVRPLPPERLYPPPPRMQPTDVRPLPPEHLQPPPPRMGEPQRPLTEPRVRPRTRSPRRERAVPPQTLPRVAPAPAVRAEPPRNEPQPRERRRPDRPRRRERDER